MINIKKKTFVVSTTIIMLIISRFIVRIIDATVQIGEDIIFLIGFLLIVNIIIGFTSFKMYKMIANK